MAFTLPELPYGFDSLEPHIDTTTMQIHHGKHHQAYVNNLNAAIEKAPELAGKSLDDLMRGINSVPEAVRTAVRNNGGGHWNHSFFWKLMGPASGGNPSGKVGRAIDDVFGFHAVQLGPGGVDFLRENRMPLKVRAGSGATTSLRCAPEHLPLASHSIDLLAFPAAPR